MCKPVITRDTVTDDVVSVAAMCLARSCKLANQGPRFAACPALIDTGFRYSSHTLLSQASVDPWDDNRQHLALRTCGSKAFDRR